MGPKDIYLILYNAFCCAGWAVVLKLAVTTVMISGDDDLWGSLANVYSTEGLKDFLTYSQTAALLEIVHAAVGLVRSPVVVTALQVGSRIAALWAVNASAGAQNQWGAGVMILSWSLVEVFRYMFYATAIVTGDSTKKTPYVLFWLRYSLFAVLYPTGITGELTVFFKAASDPAFGGLMGGAVAFVYAEFLPVVYFIGSIPMIMNMVGNRRSAFRKRAAKPPPPPRGIVFPIDNKEKGTRGSTPVNKEILASAVGAVNPEKAEAIRKAKGYRFTYTKHLIGLVEEQCKSPENALKIAQAGLDKAHEIFEFVAPDGSSTSLKEAMAAKNTEKFETGFVKGEGSRKAGGLEVPYKGEILREDALKAQVRKWVDYGTIEATAGDAIIGCVDNPEWCDLSDRYFVLLGAGSAMGPLHVLLALGANVVAIDLDRPGIWKRLIGLARGSAGTMTFPLHGAQDKLVDDDELYASAGCNLFTHTPMIRDWLMDLYKGKPFVVGSYAYLNGALHVQVSVAMDAITKDLSEKRPGTSLAYLCTPTDLHLVPEEVYNASNDNYKLFNSKPLCSLMRLLSNGKLLKKNMRKPVAGEGGDFYLVNGISVAQGPNYILAKRMQHWRAVVARSKGCTVSTNIAPATSTQSVVQNRTFAWAYEGMPYFTPYEIFAPETSNSVMTAILFSDLSDLGSCANPKNPLKNPNSLFSYGSFHGGNWRCAYMVDSIGETSVLLYFSRIAGPYVAVVSVAGVAVAAKVMGYV